MKPAILIIDDEEGFRLFLTDVLEDAGYSAACTKDGISALALVKKQRFDLIVTDIGLPDLPGLELIARLRLFGCYVPIIAITGQPDGGATLAEAETYGADSVLHKPFTSKKIVAMISELIGKRDTTMTTAVRESIPGYRRS